MILGIKILSLTRFKNSAQGYHAFLAVQSYRVLRPVYHNIKRLEKKKNEDETSRGSNREVDQRTICLRIDRVVSYPNGSPSFISLLRSVKYKNT